MTTDVLPLAGNGSLVMSGIAGVAINFPVSQGIVYYLRVHPVTTTYTDTGTVTWASKARFGVLAVAALADVATTPGWLTVTASNGTPFDPVDFSVDFGVTIFSAQMDVAGQVVAMSVPLPALAAGAHTITGTTPTLAGTASFQVLGPSTPYPAPRPIDTAPTAPVQIDAVVKWVLQDPTSGGVNYLFPINPSKMSPPHAARVFVTEHSTAPDGRTLTFEGAPVGVDWQIEGVCRTQDFHDTLETFLALPRRLYLIDHLRRAWTVSLEDVKWSRLAEAYNDWAFTYQMKTIIYAGPVQL